MIILKTPQEIELIGKASRVVALTIAFLRERVKPGITTADLDRWAEDFIVREGARPAFKGYRVPSDAVHSVNEEVVHGIHRRRSGSRKATSSASTWARWSKVITVTQR
jgi:methionyl aminopeptidase